MESFARIVNDFYSLTIDAKFSILGAYNNPVYAFAKDDSWNVYFQYLDLICFDNCQLKKTFILTKC